MVRYVCDACGWVYDPEIGVPELDIEAGIRFQDLPEDFVCPLCGAEKAVFSPED